MGGVGSDWSDGRSGEQGQGRDLRAPILDWMFIILISVLMISQCFISYTRNCRGGGGTFTVLPLLKFSRGWIRKATDRTLKRGEDGWLAREE